MTRSTALAFRVEMCVSGLVCHPRAALTELGLDTAVKDARSGGRTYLSSARIAPTFCEACPCIGPLMAAHCSKYVKA